MLYDVNGSVITSRGNNRAERSLKAEERVRQELKQIDSLLDVKFYETIGRYALVAKWPSHDPRWQMYNSGEIDDFHDILGWFTVDMYDANTDAIDVDQMEGRVREVLGKMDNNRVDWQYRLKDIAEKNIKRRKELRQGVIDQVEEVARNLEYMAGHNEEVTMKRIMKEIAQNDRG